MPTRGQRILVSNRGSAKTFSHLLTSQERRLVRPHNIPLTPYFTLFYSSNKQFFRILIQICFPSQCLIKFYFNIIVFRSIHIVSFNSCFLPYYSLYLNIIIMVNCFTMPVESFTIHRTHTECAFQPHSINTFFCFSLFIFIHILLSVTLHFDIWYIHFKSQNCTLQNNIL